MAEHSVFKLLYEEMIPVVQQDLIEFKHFDLYKDQL